MRRIAIRGLMACSFMALAGTVHAESVNTVDEVIQKYITALGGREKVSSIKSMRLSGKITFGTGGAVEGTCVAEVKRPDKVRTEVTMQGMTDIEVFDGKIGWAINGSRGKTEAEKLPAEEGQAIGDRVNVESPLIDYAKKGYKAELVGREDVEGAAAHKIKLTAKGGQSSYYYLDAEQFLPIKIVFHRKVQGTETVFEQAYSDYRKVDGLMMYHWIQGREGSNVDFTVTVDKVVLNADLPDERFSMPAKKK